MNPPSRSPTISSDQGEETALLKLAEKLVFVRPIVPYPGWRFDADWDNPDIAFQLRRRIWSHFRDRGAAAAFQMPWHNGLQLHLCLGNDLSKQVFVGGCHEPNEMALLGELLRPGMMFVDVGANEGLFTLFTAGRVGPEGRVLAFEPSEREFRRLEHNLQSNGLTNVAAHRLALSDQLGQAELLVADNEHSGQNTLGRFVHRDVGELRRESVELRTLDEMVRAAGFSQVDVLKVDAEGAETRVLRGCDRVLREMRPVVIFELLPEALARQGSSMDEVREIFSRAGYSLFEFDEATGRPTAAIDPQFEGSLIAAPAECRFPEGLYARMDSFGGMTSSPVRRATVSSHTRFDQEKGASGSEDATRPYLSVVVTSRNDDHGGSLLRRMQTFVNAFTAQSKRHSLSAELILVEWNPPPGRPPLSEALHWPEDGGTCQVRIIQVPPALHRRYEHADALPLYQMIAKNAGIRRARGQFVLATNIDILFNDELVRFIAAGGLQTDRMYRIDRHDAMTDVPEHATVDEQLDYCRTHLLRVNAREGTLTTTAEGRLDVPLPRPTSSSEDRGAAGVVSFESGWYPAEQYVGEVFRWAGPDATVTVRRPVGRERTLILEVEPSPHAGAGPLSLRVFSPPDRLFGEVTVGGRVLLSLSLPQLVEEATVRFCVLRNGLPVPQNQCPQAFRVFGHEWTEGGQEGSAGLNATPVPCLRRLSTPFRRLARAVRSLWRQEGPIRFGLPFSATLVRKLGLRITPSGVVVDPSAPPAPGPVQAPSPSTQPPVPLPLHTNACGDFTLMALEHWLALRGYPEFDAYSFNIDSLLCFAAHHAGVREELLEDPMRIYHIEHGMGSGWTPEGQEKLFERLAAKGVPYVDWQDIAVWAAQMRRLNSPMIFNGETWGLSAFELRETIPTPGSGRR